MATLYTEKSHNVAKTWIFMGFFLVLVVALGWFLSYYYNDPAILYFAVIFSVVMNIWSYWFSDKVALSMSRAQPAPKEQYPDLYNIVENLSITAGLPMPKIYIINDGAPNAFATGRNKNHASIAVTSGLLSMMNKTELEGVIAHELSHVDVQQKLSGQARLQHTEHVGGKMAWYYNFWVSEHNRQPLAKIDTIFVNNTEYNFQAGYTVADTSGNFRHNIINNYFITGPTDTSGGNAFYQMDANQSIYATGNLRDNNNDGVLNGSSISPGGGGTVLSAPWSTLSTNTTVYSTAGAYRFDVSQTGVLPRDQLDSLILSQIKTLGNGPAGTGAGTAGPGGGLYNDQTSTGLGNNGYGILNGGMAPLDSDQDGLPDYWELALGSNPNVADSLTPGTGGYTKLENYLNWLAGPHAVASKNSFVDVDLRQYTSGFTNVSPVYAAFAPTNGLVALLPDGHTAEFTAAGNFSGLGSFNFSVNASDGTAMTNTVVVLVTATGASQNLTWRGDGAINNWDTTSTNWVSGTNPVSFGAGDIVTFDDTGSNNPAINLVGALTPASVTVAANQNYIFGGSGSLGGTMSLAKDGAGILTIGTSNKFSGGTFVQGGAVVMGNATANVYGLGTGALTFSDGTRLTLFDAGASTDAGTLPNNLVVSGSTILELPERGGAGGTLTGSGTFNLITHYVRGNFNDDCSAYSGTLSVFSPDSGGADFRIGSYAGFANATVILSNNINAYFITTISPSGNTVDFGQINAPASATLRGGPTGGRAVTLRIGALGTDSSFAGSIVEQIGSSTTSLVKIGAGASTSAARIPIPARPSSATARSSSTAAPAQIL